MGLFWHIVGLFGHTMDLFWHIMGFFGHTMGLFWHTMIRTWQILGLVIQMAQNLLPVIIHGKFLSFFEVETQTLSPSPQEIAPDRSIAIGRQRSIECFKLQVSFRQRATIYTELTPAAVECMCAPCIHCVCVCVCHCEWYCNLNKKMGTGMPPLTAAVQLAFYVCTLQHTATHCNTLIRPHVREF